MYFYNVIIFQMSLTPSCCIKISVTEFFIIKTPTGYVLWYQQAYVTSLTILHNGLIELKLQDNKDEFEAMKPSLNTLAEMGLRSVFVLSIHNVCNVFVYPPLISDVLLQW